MRRKGSNGSHQNSPAAPHVRGAWRLVSLTLTFALLSCSLVLPRGPLSWVVTTAHAAPMTFTVNTTANTSDGSCTSAPGGCTLREAITAANNNPGPDTIAFNIPGGGVQTISLTLSSLPDITGPLTIDGYTQPGSSPNTLANGNNAVLLIELKGNSIIGAPTGGNGLTFQSQTGGSVVRGLVINRFDYGIEVLLGAGDIKIEGNFIGTDPAGSTALGNTIGGIHLDRASGSTIGGTAPAARNVISGNGSDEGGIRLDSVSDTLVQGNYIGTNAGGTGDLGNSGGGVVFNSIEGVGSSNNSIGGTTPGAGNVISGNDGDGVAINGDSSNYVIAGNYIGTNAAGTAQIANDGPGLSINGGSHTVGGTTPGARNVISGNNGDGIFITSGGNNVQGNYIGTGAGGGSPLGNTGNGVMIQGAESNKIGGTASGAGNVIAFNGQDGVREFGGASNSILSNAAFSNNGSGIDLFQDGVTANDLGDVDLPQNFPSLSVVTSGGGATTVVGTLDGKSSAASRIEFFANAACDPSGFGEGQTLIGSTSVTTDGSGHADFNATLPFALPAGHVVTATATDSSDNTSEFSRCLGVAPPAGFLQFSSDSYNVNESGGTATVFVVRTGGSSGTVAVNYASGDGTATGGADYTPASGVLTFADGQTVQSFDIAISNDQLDEVNETVNLSLSNPTGGALLGGQTTAALRILDDDAAPALSVNDVSVTEGNSGTTNASFTVSLSGPARGVVQLRFSTAPGTATSGSDFSPVLATLNFNPGETSRSVIVRVMGDTVPEPGEDFFVNLDNITGPVTVADSQGVGTILDDDGGPTPTPTPTPTASPAVLQFSAAGYGVQEGVGSAQIIVTRTGDASSAVTVEYATADITAGDRGDYGIAIGRLRFAAGETARSFSLFVTDDRFVEGNETLHLSLSNPTGGAVLGGANPVVLTIVDNDVMVSSLNPIDDTAFFVRQHYVDFLSREPDAAGLQFWAAQIEACGADARCRDVMRVNVSAAFFLSIEFQETGYLTHRLYRAAFNRLPRYREFIRDAREAGRGVVVGQGDWRATLEANKVRLADEFVGRADFALIYGGLADGQYVDALNANTGGSFSAAERDALVAGLGGGTETRATVLRKVAEDADFAAREFNAAFVLAQYFGYLQRNPDDPPDSDTDGYLFWLSKLDQFGGDFRKAEMVRAFISSTEYRARFGQ
jgi:CSLREA domain-containing protein